LIVGAVVTDSELVVSSNECLTEMSAVRSMSLAMVERSDVPSLRAPGWRDKPGALRSLVVCLDSASRFMNVFAASWTS
jgi:hypothetical protein